MVPGCMNLLKDKISMYTLRLSLPSAAREPEPRAGGVPRGGSEGFASLRSEDVL